MFTSRAEYRLILREDNAAARLCPSAASLGLLGCEQQEKFEQRTEVFQSAAAWLAGTRISPEESVNAWLESRGSAKLKDSILLETLLRRPEIKLSHLVEQFCSDLDLPAETAAALEVEVKFSGYLRRQEEEIARLQRVEHEVIPADFPYDSIESLRTEAREKLKRYRPVSIGQAMRIPGMTPSAISLLAVHLKRYRASAA
jgi:tRNA uridine 5-carboxymethylaminomethyl modification enzyme